MTYPKVFYVSTLEIAIYEDGEVELDTGVYGQAFLNKEQQLKLVEILLQEILHRENNESIQ